MYKHKLEGVKASTPSTARLQHLLLEYHDFRLEKRCNPLLPWVALLEQWQSERLRHTHQALYHQSHYRDALDFLLRDLYTPTNFTRRDEDLDRIFPVLVKMLPEGTLDTVARLVELNLLTQQMDLALAAEIAALDIYTEPPPVSLALAEAHYCDAYRRAGINESRLRQIELADQVARELERYVRSRFLSVSLRMTRKPAKMAGLGQLHDFLERGLRAFRGMGGVQSLMNEVTRVERQLHEAILAGAAMPFGFAPLSQNLAAAQEVR